MPFEDSPDRSVATLYRKVIPGHLCPFGLKSKDLLERHGYRVEDHHLTTQEEAQALMQRLGVKTTPQTIIGGERIGGHSDLRVHLGLDDPDHDGTTYRPIIALFAVSALLALAAGWAVEASATRMIEWFVAIAMTLLGLQKLKDVEAFSTMFLGYDLLARRWVRYAYIYPYAETGAGILMVAGVLPWLSGPVALIIGSIGALSVYKAVYVERRALKCACVGGDTKVPLGFVSLTENLVMIAMGLWALRKVFSG